MNTEFLLPFLGELFVKSIAILLVAALIVRAWRGSSAAQRHFVWLAATGIMLLLPTTRLMTPRWIVPLATHAEVSAPGVVVVSSGLPAHPLTPALAEPRGSAPRISTWRWPDWGTALVSAWIVGVAIVLIYRSLGSWRLRGLERGSARLEDARVLSMATGILRELGIRREVAVRISAACRVPMTWGTRHPVLMLPAEALQWSDARIRTALRHEAGHIRRQDYLVRWVAQVACAMYWPNPLIWLAARSLRVAQEQATDDLVLQAGTPPDEYAAHLFEAARTVAADGFLHAVAMASPSTLEDRVLGIVDSQRDRRPLSGSAAMAGSMISALAFAICTAAQLQGADTGPAPVRETIAPAASRQNEPEVTITARFVDLSPEFISTKGAPKLDGVFTDAQFQAILRELAQGKGVDVLSAPSVTTKDQQKAAIEVIREFRYPTDWEKNSAGAWTPKAFGLKKVGVSLGATPAVKTDGSISLRLEPRVVKFLGMINLENGQGIPADLAPGVDQRWKPVFSERQLNANITLKSGETAAFATIPETAEVKPFEKTARVGRLVVFVSATISERAAGKTGASPVPGAEAISNPEALLPHAPDKGVAKTAPRAPAEARSRELTGSLGRDGAAAPSASDGDTAPQSTPPVARWVPGKPGFVISPHAPDAGYVDVRGFEPGTQVKCPYTGKMFLVPPLPVQGAGKAVIAPGAGALRESPTESRIGGRVGIEIRGANSVLDRGPIARRPGEN